MKLIGILLILNSIGLAAWWISTNGNHKTAIVTLCFVAIFSGLALILQDRITEFTVKGVGTIKAATQQAESDAKLVSELKERVENQSATVDLVAQEASNAKALSEEVASNKSMGSDSIDQGLWSTNQWGQTRLIRVYGLY